MTQIQFPRNPNTNGDVATTRSLPAARRASVAAVTLAASLWLAAPAAAAPFFFSTGVADDLLGARSQPAAKDSLAVETADDFVLAETTAISHATIVGLVPSGTSLADVVGVEVELYHLFPRDSVGVDVRKVPSRVNSPADVEIGNATRDAGRGTLEFHAGLLSASSRVLNSVSNGIHEVPGNLTHGDGEVRGELVEIDITFTPPIVLPADHYFFRPEVEVAGGQFLFVSAPKPIAAPGTAFTGDLQAWIRDSALQPDWLRIGTDIIGDIPPRTFNMTVSLDGETVPQAGTPGTANCRGKSSAALAAQFGSIEVAASALGFASVESLQQTFRGFCFQGRPRGRA